MAARVSERLFSIASSRKSTALPGVDAAGAISFLPLMGLGAATSMEIVGKPIPPRVRSRSLMSASSRTTTCKTMGIPLIKGRLFKEDDPSDARDRVVINQTMAERYWPGEDPIGKQVRISWDGRTDEVIGVVGNVRHAGLDVESRAMIYWPFARNNYGTMTVCGPRQGEPTAPLAAVAGIVRAARSAARRRQRQDDGRDRVRLRGPTTLDDADADDLCRRRTAARCRSASTA